MRRTKLYEFHVEAGARIVPFAGWEMPVQYEGVIKEHEAVRKRAGLFDVSHMGIFTVDGGDAQKYLDSVVTADVAALADGDVVYSLLLNEKGGAIDDILVYRDDAKMFYLVVNASNASKDLQWMQSRTGHFKVAVDDISDNNSLVALQGPLSADILRGVIQFPDGLAYYKFAHSTFNGQPIIVSRTGYTGEDGFEIFAGKDPIPLWQALLDTEIGGVKAAPCGLGARDLLRIEAGYPLYGHELNDEINPIDAGLKWALKKGDVDFIGKSALDGMKRGKKRVGFIMNDRAVPREGYPILVDGEPLGAVTSGTFSPVLQKPIGIGYISRRKGRFPDAGDGIEVEVRGKRHGAKICKMPFIKPGVMKG